MEAIFQIVGVLGSILVFLIIFFFLAYIFAKHLYLSIKEKVLNLKSFANNPKLTPRQRAYLIKNISYYGKLSQESRKEFEKRVVIFMNTREYVGEEITVTDEMKVLIAGSAIQLTFGLNKYMLKGFRRIIIYPDIFSSKAVHKKRRFGEVRKFEGEVVLSWKHFMEGYAVADDANNVGLHELAHALEFETFMNGLDDLFHEYYPNWGELASHSMLLIRKGQNKFLRKYAGTDMNEMFAVCIETFFEQPDAFAKEMPLLYEILTIILNQDPRKYNDPRGNISHNIKPVSTSRYSYAAVIIGAFLFMPTLLSCYYVYNQIGFYFLGQKTTCEIVKAGNSSITYIFNVNGEKYVDKSSFLFNPSLREASCPNGMPVFTGNKFELIYNKNNPMVNYINYDKPDSTTLNYYFEKTTTKLTSWLDYKVYKELYPNLECLIEQTYQHFGVDGLASLYFYDVHFLDKPFSNNSWTYGRLIKKEEFKKATETCNVSAIYPVLLELD